MATWNGVITNAGNSLLNEWVNEKALNFDSAAAGQGTVAAAAMMAQTALVSQKQTASLLGGEKVSSGIRLKLRIAAPNTAYTLNQYGVWASVEGGSSTMIALFQLEQGIPIPSKTESPDFVYTFYALISCSNTGTWTVTVDTSACVTQSDMSTAIAKAVETKQDKITVKGLLLGDGNGNISAAVAGKDYGYPLATGSGAPTATTAGAAGQHYYDSSTGKEYVCSGKDGSGNYQWTLSGASDAADLTYNGESLATFLDGVSDDFDTLSKELDGSKPLTGTTDPTSSTQGAVGQTYLNTDTMQTFYCTAADDETGTYTWEKPKGGGVAPQLEVSVTTGSTVTCTDGETTLTGTSVDGKCTFDLPGYGTWSLYATLNGQTTATETVTVDQVKQYAVTLSYFAATLTVTAESGAVVTATLGTKKYTGTCGSNGKCALTVNYAGTYSVTATKNNVSSSTVSAVVSASGGSYTATVKFCTLTVTIDSGSTVKAVNGSTTSTGTAKFYLPNTGTWSITATLNGETATSSIACSSYTDYTLELSYVKVFGVCWNYGAQSTALSRLTKTSDPNGLVNVNITTEPSPALGTGAGSSPFDSYLPWSGMEEYNIINNAVSYKKGASGFSRSSYDTAVYIPEYYFRIVDDATNKKRYFYIADKAKSGFTKHPGSGKYVGRYNTILLQNRLEAAGQYNARNGPHQLQKQGQQVGAIRLRFVVCGLAFVPGGICRLEQPERHRHRHLRQQLYGEYRRHGQHELPYRHSGLFPDNGRRRSVPQHRKSVGQYLGVDRRRQLLRWHRLCLHHPGKLCRRYDNRLYERRNEDAKRRLYQSHRNFQRGAVGLLPDRGRRQRDNLHS